MRTRARIDEYNAVGHILVPDALTPAARQVSLLETRKGMRNRCFEQAAGVRVMEVAA